MVRRALWAMAWCQVLCASSACGPIEYVSNVPFEATGAIAEAKHMRAAELAPYEITAADEYVHKSRELAGQARFQSAVEFARKATAMARKAKEIAQQHASSDAPNASDAIDRNAVPEEAPEKSAPDAKAPAK